MSCVAIKRIVINMVMLILFLGAATSIRSSSIRRIHIDVSRPQTVTSPFGIVPIGEAGERGLYIAPGAGRGWKDEAGGDAVYSFFVPDDSQYSLWALCLWHNECTNAIYAQIDDRQRTIIGNDPVFDKWHWVRGPEYDLQRGQHVLRLSNHSDNLAVLDLVLTNSSDLPDDDRPLTTSLFYDGFDGCDKGNFYLWKQVTGRWDVIHRAYDPAGNNGMLSKTSVDKGLLVLPDRSWDNYILKVSVQTPEDASPDATAAICFGMENPDQYYLLRWREPTKPSSVTMELLRNDGERINTIRAFEKPWKPGQWHDIEIEVYPGQIGVSIDYDECVITSVPEIVHGSIGLQVSGKAKTRFDNIEVIEHKSKAK